MWPKRRPADGSPIASNFSHVRDTGKQRPTDSTPDNCRHGLFLLTFDIKKGFFLMPLKLNMLIGSLDCLYMFQGTYYCKTDNEFYTIPFDCTSEEDIELTETIDEHRDEYIRLPEKEEINMYGIMEDFIENLTQGKIQDQLYRAINSSRPFKRFNDAIYRFGIESKWFEYKDKRLAKIAIQWCKEHNLEYE